MAEGRCTYYGLQQKKRGIAKIISFDCWQEESQKKGLIIHYLVLPRPYSCWQQVKQLGERGQSLSKGQK